MPKKCACNHQKRWLLFILIPPFGIFLLLFLTLWKNRLPWKKQPGRRKRLLTYLRSNKAETGDDSIFPELLTPVFKTTPDALYAKSIEACQSLGWSIQDAKVNEHKIEAIIQSPLLKFKDDISISIQAVTEDWSQLHVISSSRKGKGDFGSNTRHILNLKQALHKSLKN